MKDCFEYGTPETLPFLVAHAFITVVSNVSFPFPPFCLNTKNKKEPEVCKNFVGVGKDKKAVNFPCWEWDLFVSLSKPSASPDST